MGREEPFQSIHGFSSKSLSIYKLVQQMKTILKNKKKKKK